MTRRPLALLAALAALVPAGAFAAGCGSDELSSVSAAEAASSTAAAKTARMTMTMKVSGMGLPLPMSVKAQGITAMSEPRMDVIFDFGPLMAMMGAGADADGKVRMLLDGGDIFIDPPAIDGLDLPGDSQWITADLGKAMRALGLDVTGFSELLRISPEQQVAALKAAGSVKTVGKKTVDGVETAHLRGTVKMSDYVRALPPARRKAAQKALDELDKLPGGEGQSFDQPTPIDMWIDEDHLVRRMTSKATIPAQKGVPEGRYELTMNFSDFGTALEIDRPSSRDVWDATKTITDALVAQQRIAPTN